MARAFGVSASYGYEGRRSEMLACGGNSASRLLSRAVPGTAGRDSATLSSIKAGKAVIVVHGLDPATLSSTAQKEKSDLVPSLPLAATFERHLRRCPSCVTEVRGLREAAARIVIAAEQSRRRALMSATRKFMKIDVVSPGW